MIKRITQPLRLCQLYLAFIMLFSNISFAQSTSKSPLYGNNDNELVEKRDLFAKHFINPDGSYTAAIASGPIHYEKEGSFADINNTIHPFSSTNYSYANKDNLMESYFGATAHRGVKNKTKEGEVLEFLNTTMYWEVAGLKVNEQQSANVSPITIDNRLYYNGLYESINAEFVVGDGKRKLNYIIPTANALSNAPANATYLVFTEKVILPAHWSFLKTEAGLVVSNDKQEIIYLYSNPFSYDGNDKKMRIDNTFMTVESEGNTLTIAIKVKANWLVNTNRVFPITIDPTVIVYPNASNYNTGCVYSSDFFKETTAIGFGRYDDNAGLQDFLRGWATFNTTSVPEDAIVSNGVTVNFYISDISPDFSPANGHELVFSQLSLNPVTATGSALYNAIEQFGYGPFVTTAINTVGWKAHTLTSAALQTDISNGLANNSFTIGFMPQGNFFAGEYLVADGWDANKPYLTFNYTQPLGVESFDKSLAIIYPNPAENILTIAADDQIESINIYSLVGQLVLANTLKNTIDVSSLTTGVYLTEIKFQNGQMTTKKIAKK